MPMPSNCGIAFSPVMTLASERKKVTRFGSVGSEVTSAVRWFQSTFGLYQTDVADRPSNLLVMMYGKPDSLLTVAL